MSKVYIAGKINGLKNYREIFKAVEDELLAEGNAVMNPAVLGEGFSYETYMPICLSMLQACDTVLMLNNWKDSKGAKVEHEYAKLQGKKIIYQEIDFDFDDLIVIGKKYRIKGRNSIATVTALYENTVGIIFDGEIHSEVPISSLEKI
jgi:hypothetical protein